MKIIITEKQFKILKEQFTYFEDPYFKENDIYDYEPTQSEIDDFINHKYQFKTHHQDDEVTPPMKKTGLSILYSKINGEIDHGTYALMKYKKNRMIDLYPYLKDILMVIPQKRK